MKDKEICRDCKFGETGSCIRHAPMMVISEHGPVGVFPPCGGYEQWCGDWEAKPEE